MQILLIIENIAHRQRTVRCLGNRPEPLIAKSVSGAFEYIDGLTLDSIICDLVVGSTTAAEIFARARAVDRPTPRCLCLVPDGMTNQLEVNSFREISQVDDIDFMKKSDVEQGLAPYLNRVEQGTDDTSTPSQTSTATQAPISESRAMAASPNSSADAESDVRNKIMQLDKQHEEIANALSQVQDSFAAVEKQVSVIESRMDRIESRIAVPADQES